MKKFFVALAVLSTIGLTGASAHAWVCVAQAADGAVGQGFHPYYLAQAQRLAIIYCRANSVYPATCSLVGCE